MVGLTGGTGPTQTEPSSSDLLEVLHPTAIGYAAEAQRVTDVLQVA
jgi:hypothetical protein